MSQEYVNIACTCNTTYSTIVETFLDPRTDPPVQVERAQSLCPSCNNAYHVETAQTPSRTITVTPPSA